MNLTESLPTGHPRILYGNADIGNPLADDGRSMRYRGIHYVTMQPPDDLLHPVLGLQINNKLM